MVEHIKQSSIAKFVLSIFLLLSLWWLFINVSLDQESVAYQLFAAIYGVVALIGALCGFYVSKRWGGMRSLLGNSIIMFSLGLVAQEFGQLVYSFYIFFLHIPVPYPSLGDVGYFGSIFFYIYGSYLLAKASGVKVGLKSFENKIQAIIIPSIILISSYLLFLRQYEFDWTNPLKIFLDFGYPLGQAIYISITILTFLLSRKVLGGMMRSRVIFILIALCIQYAADYIFLFQSSRGIWHAGGINDYVYLLAYFLMTVAIVQFSNVYSEIQHKI